MKKTVILLALAVLGAQASRAADLIVDITGVGGAYMSIQSAIDAASAGDRILVYPNATHYSENLSINKGIEITTATEGEYFKLSGTITVNTSNTLPADAEITLSSINFLSGNVTYSYSGAGSQINIVGCKFNSGAISFNTTGYNLNVANDSLMNGYVYFRVGKVVGNYIDATTTGAYAIYETTDNTLVSDEPNYIVGNTVILASQSWSYAYTTGIYCGSTSHYAYIANNFLTRSNNTTYQYGIHIGGTKSGAGENYILNNTIVQDNSVNWGVYVNSYNSTNRVFNNLVLGTGNQYGIAAGAYNLNNFVSYNHIEATTTAMNTGIIDDGTNNTSGGNSIDPLTGQLLAGPSIDGGNPDAAFTDLDLSTNDAGCYGGSFSKANFDAMSGLTGSKTTFMFAPRRVLVGETISIQGQGFDH